MRRIKTKNNKKNCAYLYYKYVEFFRLDRRKKIKIKRKEKKLNNLLENAVENLFENSVEGFVQNKLGLNGSGTGQGEGRNF